MTRATVHRLERKQTIQRPLERVFPFFERPENLALITPTHLNFKLLTPSPVSMEQGRIIDYTIRVMGMTTRWRSLISTYDPPHCFVDEQLVGPYSFWHHTHRFIQQGNATIVHDSVRYALPIYLPAPLSAALNHFYVQPLLDRIFNYRRDLFDYFFSSQSERLQSQSGQLLRSN